MPVRIISRMSARKHQPTEHSRWLQNSMTREDVSQYALAKRSGVPQPTIQRILSGETQNPKADTLAALARALGEEYTSSQAARPSSSEDEPLQAETTTESVVRCEILNTEVPVVSWVQAGEMQDVCDPYPAGCSDEWLPCPSAHGPSTFALRVRGDSMVAPHGGGRSYPEGTVIFVDPEQQPENGSRVVAKLDGQATFKVLAEDAGRKYLRPLNPQYPTVEINGNVEIIGRVIGAYMPE